MKVSDILPNPVSGPILVGLLAGIPYLLATPKVEPTEPPYNYLLIANVILLAGALVYVFRRAERFWMTGVVMSLGVCAMVLGRVLFDYAFVDRLSHNRYPIECLVAIALTGPGIVVGSLIGFYGRKRFRKKSAEDPR